MSDNAGADGTVRQVGNGCAEADLPVTTVQCHAANLMRVEGGDLACVWFGGTQEGTHDTGVFFSRLSIGATAWSKAVRLSDDGERSEQNPLLFAAPDGRLWLLYTAQRAGNQATAEIRCRISGDGGTTWSAARTLIPADARGGVFVRQSIVALPDGRWVLPIFRCKAPRGAAWAGDDDSSSVLVSDDSGARWTERPVPASTGAVHMNILALKGCYLALYRSRWADKVYASRSIDGLAWNPPTPTVLPNNNSSIQAAVLSGGTIALAHNNSSAAQATGRRAALYDEIGNDGHVLDGGTVLEPGAARARDLKGGRGKRCAFWGAPRAPLTLSLSYDGGVSWPWQRDLVTGDGYCLTNDSRHRRNRELSYPSLSADADGTLHVAYTHHRRAIKYLRLDPGWHQSDFERAGVAADSCQQSKGTRCT